MTHPPRQRLRSNLLVHVVPPIEQVEVEQRVRSPGHSSGKLPDSEAVLKRTNETRCDYIQASQRLSVRGLQVELCTEPLHTGKPIHRQRVVDHDQIRYGC